MNIRSSSKPINPLIWGLVGVMKSSTLSLVCIMGKIHSFTQWENALTSEKKTMSNTQFDCQQSEKTYISQEIQEVIWIFVVIHCKLVNKCYSRGWYDQHELVADLSVPGHLSAVGEVTVHCDVLSCSNSHSRWGAQTSSKDAWGKKITNDHQTYDNFYLLLLGRKNRKPEEIMVRHATAFCAHTPFPRIPQFTTTWL